MIYGDTSDRGRRRHHCQRSAKPSAERFSLTDAEVEELARQALTIEQHYGRPMDIEWGKDGGDGELYILQARPETVQKPHPEPDSATLPVEPTRSGGAVRAAPSARRSVPARARLIDSVSRDGSGAAGRRAGHRHDRPGLGADHETGRCDRHQPRRAHLPRRHHRPRIGDSGGGGLRRRHRSPLRTAARSPSPAPRAIPVSCTTACSTSTSREIELDNMPELPVKIMMNVGNPDRAFDFARFRTMASGWRGWSSSSTA